MAILRICNITFIHTWAAIFCSTSQMSTSWSCSGERLPPLPSGGAVLPPFGWCSPPRLGLPQFLLSTSCLFQQFIHHTFKSPYNYYTSLNTSTHVGIMGARHDIHIYLHNLQSFFLFSFLTSKQVSWPWTLKLGTSIFFSLHAAYLPFSCRVFLFPHAENLSTLIQTCPYAEYFPALLQRFSASSYVVFPHHRAEYFSALMESISRPHEKYFPVLEQSSSLHQCRVFSVLMQSISPPSDLVF